MYQQKERRAIALIALFSLSVSCSSKKDKELLVASTSKKLDSLSATSSCYQCFDSLVRNKVNVDRVFETIYKRVIVGKNPQDQDFCLLFWFLLKSNDESLNESMGEHIFKSFKTNKAKQSALSRNLGNFSKEMRDTLTANLINLMSIDIEAYSSIDQFKTDFPLFSDNTSLSVVSELISQP